MALSFPQLGRMFSSPVGGTAISIHSAGGIFVDYRRAPPVNPDVAVSLLGSQIQWLTPASIGIDLEWRDDGDRREWKVSGAEAGEPPLRSRVDDQGRYYVSVIRQESVLRCP